MWWDDVTTADVEAFRAALENANDERPLQAYLAGNPKLLVQHLGGGHGRWVISQKRLGAEYVPDFLIGEKSSVGHEWRAVELQSPTAQLFNRRKPCRQSAHLDEGIKQILEWRRWLAANRDYARRPTDEQGLGLVGIDDKCEGLLLIGREDHVKPEDNERRRQLGHDLRIKIRTYDWITREAQRRIEDLQR